MDNLISTEKVQYSNVLQHIFGRITPPPAPVIMYALNQTPPYLYVVHGGQHYKVALDGATKLVFGSVEIPAPGCPIPERLFWASFMFFVFRNRVRVFNASLICAILALTVFTLSMYCPVCEESLLSLFALGSVVMNSILIVGAALIVLALFLYNFGKGIKLPVPQVGPQMLLPPGELKLGIDLPVVSISESEPDADFAMRLERAEATQQAGQYIVVIPFQSPVGTIVVAPPDEDNVFQGYNFHRDTPPYQGEGWPEENRIVPFGKRFQNETFTEYTNYLVEFSNHYPEWAKAAKANTGDPLAAIRLGAKKMTSTILIVCFLCVSLFSQKSEQVKSYLGYRYENDKPVGTVRFEFQKAPLLRQADGTKTYKDLLPDKVGYTDSDNAGRLVGITVEGQTIQPAQREAQPATLTAKNVAKEQPEPTALFGSNPGALPDSIRVRRQMEQIKGKLPFYKSMFWAFVQPAIEFLMYLLWFFIPITAGVTAGALGLFNIISRSAAENGNLGSSVARLQVVFARYSWFISMFQVCAIYVAIILTMFFREMGLGAICTFSLVGYIAGKFIINRFTPNGQYQASITTKTTNFNQPRLDR